MFKKYFWHILIDIIAVIVAITLCLFLHYAYHGFSKYEGTPVAPYNPGIGPLPSQPGIPQQ